MKLTDVFKKPNIRFKTVPELITEYGGNWMDTMIPFDPVEVIQTIGMFGGKPFYPSLVSAKGQTYGYYGPTDSSIHVSMFTTKSIPKYDSRGDILKPGMIVRIEYFSATPIKDLLLFANLRNEPGTIVRILKVIKPFDLVKRVLLHDEMDKWCIATELIRPFSGRDLDIIKCEDLAFFKGNDVCAFELAHRVTKTTKLEREFYYKTKQ